jgi:crossover junction endodeoxyribonuclease RusA
MNEPTPAQDDLLCSLDLPFPPSVNSYWRNVAIGGKPRTLISEAGRAYKSEVFGVVVGARATAAVHPDARIAVYILLKMPDRRRRDVDNYLKSLLDAITEAKVWNDDSQIDLLTIERGEIEADGRALVEVYELPGRQKVLTIGG